MADTKENKSRRDAHIERLRKKYPDKAFADDEEIFSQISDDYDDYDRRLGESAKREQAFSDMFTSDPRSARLMMDWKNGDDPAVALIRIYGKDYLLDAINDPEKLDEIAKANKEFAERIKKETQYEEEYKQNLTQTLKGLESYVQQNGISDDDLDAAMQRLTEICRDYILGKVSPETVEMLMKGINHDSDVAAASQEGEIAGRNARIEETLRKPQSDGTVPLGGKNAAPPRKKTPSIFDIAAQAR